MHELLEKNEYLKKQILKLEHWDYDHLRCNDISGVDAIVYLDMKEFGDLADDESFDDELNDFLTDYGMHYSSKYNEISISTSDESFISFDGKELTLPETNKSEKILSDFHTWLLLEEHFLTNGILSGIYKVGYYGDCDEYKFDKNYMEMFSEDEKQRLKEVRELLEIFDLTKNFDNHTIHQVDLPQKIYENLPQVIKNLESCEIMQLDDITRDSFSIVFEIEIEDSEDGEKLQEKLLSNGYKIVGGDSRYGNYVHFGTTISLRDNSIRFILGGGDEMSFVSIR
jgi:hypothetical protein